MNIYREGKTFTVSMSAHLPVFDDVPANVPCDAPKGVVYIILKVFVKSFRPVCADERFPDFQCPFVVQMLYWHPMVIDRNSVIANGNVTFFPFGVAVTMVKRHTKLHFVNHILCIY